MNTILQDYESVWHIWPQNKYRSLWPIFHDPLILPYILKTDVWTSYIRIMSQYDPTFDLKLNVGHCDLYFMVQWFLAYILKTLIYEHYKSVWPDVWPKNKCRSLWPIFPDPVILPYILKTVWCMNIILQDYESVWPDIWPQNKCRSLWPIFNGPVILPYILKPIWYMNTILWDYESVWPDVRPKNKCRSLWPIFHGPVILPYILTV